MAQKAKVMLIEDNENCREICASMIRLLGYKLIWPHGNAAKDTPDVIVVYLDFPHMRTLHTVRALRDDQRTKDIPIIVFLPWTHGDGKLAALEAGANEAFDGPLKFEALQAGITKYAPEDFDQSEPRRGALENDLSVAKPDVLTTKEAAALLRITTRTLYKLAKDGKISGIRIGTLWGFNRADLERYMRAQGTGQEDGLTG